MNIENLTPQDEVQIRLTLIHLQKKNPLLTWSSFPMDTRPTIHDRINQADIDLFLGETEDESRLRRLEEKVDTLLTRLDLIFGDQVVLNGRFVNIKDMHHG